jgi:two-component system, cell cycle sensor histidine kinase and response regulator CckA
LPPSQKPAIRKAVKILLVEDNQGNADLFTEYLRIAGEFDPVRVSRLSEAFNRLSEGDVELILLDLNLPDSNGLDTLRRVHAKVPGIPIIVLTAHSGESMITEAIREGAQDYLVKTEIVPNLLNRSIRYSIERHHAAMVLKDLELRLLQSQKMEAVGRLAGGVAHDFNNLLTAILGYCKLLETSLDAGDRRISDLNEITEASKRAASLTGQLLAFSRRQVLAPKVLNLNRTVTTMEKMLRRLIGEDLNFSVSLDPKLNNIRADAGQLEQVIMNLAVNARDAMPKGGRISVETGNIAFSEDSPGRHDVIPSGDYVMVAVSDTGCGMTTETLSHIFEPFFTTKEQGKGTGLGLCTVFGIVKQSGGYVWVYSEPGQGSAFKIYFPITKESVEQPKDDRVSPKTLRGSETILLAEDDASVRHMLVRTLRQNGYTVLEASNGKDAIGIIEQRGDQIQLIITDIVMPELGGRGLADYVNLVRPQTRIIFMSGYTDDVIIRHGELDPGMVFLQKPITLESFLQKIRYVLETPSRPERLLADKADPDRAMPIRA